MGERLLKMGSGHTAATLLIRLRSEGPEPPRRRRSEIEQTCRTREAGAELVVA